MSGLRRKRKRPPTVDSTKAAIDQEAGETIGKKIQHKVLDFIGSISKAIGASTASQSKDKVKKEKTSIVLDDEEEEEMAKTAGGHQPKQLETRKVRRLISGNKLEEGKNV